MDHHNSSLYAETFPVDNMQLLVTTQSDTIADAKV